MTTEITDKMKKLWKKLLKAWTQGKEKKAIKIQHKLLKEELKKNDKFWTTIGTNDYAKTSIGSKLLK